MKPDEPNRRSKIEIATAASAVACIGGLVGLSVTGVLEKLPLPVSVSIVVAELLTPAFVYFMLKRKSGGG